VLVVAEDLVRSAGVAHRKSGAVSGDGMEHVRRAAPGPLLADAVEPITEGPPNPFDLDLSRPPRERLGELLGLHVAE